MVIDEINVFSAEVEVKKQSRLICLAIDRFNLNFDPEQALLYYVACRSILLNNDDLQKVF